MSSLMALFHCPFASNDTGSVDSANRIFSTFDLGK